MSMCSEISSRRSFREPGRGGLGRADLDSSQILPTVEKLDAAMGAVRSAHPGYNIAVTGLSAIAARNSASMIGKLNHGLTIEFLLAVFIGLAFRSVVVMTANPAGHLPVVLSGTVLWLLGRGCNSPAWSRSPYLRSIGIERHHPLPQPAAAGGKPGVDEAQAVERATVLVGPALILTTVSWRAASWSRCSRTCRRCACSWLSAFSMIAALIADLLSCVRRRCGS